MPRRHKILAAILAAPAALALTPILALTLALTLFGTGLPLMETGPAAAQVWEPGDPPREAYGLPGEEPQVPDAPPDTQTQAGETQVDERRAGAPEAGMMPVAEQGDREEEKTAQPSGTPLAPKREAEQTPAEPEAARRIEASDPEDFLCARAPAGKAITVPPPFDRWLVRVCSPRGQALVPVLGEAWVAHNSADPVSILAMPPGAVPPPTAGAFDARYDIRFDILEGGKAEGERLRRAEALLAAATPAGETPFKPDAIWQLDAVSNVAATRYNLFFYLSGERPGRIIACLDQCRQALFLDVLRGQEAKDAIGRQTR